SRRMVLKSKTAAAAACPITANQTQNVVGTDHSSLYPQTTQTAACPPPSHKLALRVVRYRYASCMRAFAIRSKLIIRYALNTNTSPVNTLGYSMISPVEAKLISSTETPLKTLRVG